MARLRLAGLRDWARRLKNDVLALWLAARDRRTPWAPKVIAVAVVAYALSPIDLIPDMIPALGYLDDLLILPLGIWLAVRLMPAALMAGFRAQAEGMPHPVSRAGLVMVLLTWAALLAGGVWWWAG